MAFTLEPGAAAPKFTLPGVDGKTYRLEDFSQKVLVLNFTCNHCPYVIGNEARERAFVETYVPRGVAYVAINSNETKDHPTDGFTHMQERARRLNFTWPYLRDDSQAVARAYGAIKTPHFFVLDEGRVVRYVGRMDDAPRDAAKATTRELADAVEDLLAGRTVRVSRTDPIGCTVKWWGKDRHFVPGEACDLD